MVHLVASKKFTQELLVTRSAELNYPSSSAAPCFYYNEVNAIGV